MWIKNYKQVNFSKFVDKFILKIENLLILEK